MSYVEATPLGARARRRRILRRRFLRRPAAVISLVIVVGAVLAAIFARWVAPYSPDQTDFEAILAGPSREHLLGTDELGRDTLSRIVWGARASIQARVSRPCRSTSRSGRRARHRRRAAARAPRRTSRGPRR